MKSALKYLLPVMAAFVGLGWAGCTDPAAVIDQNTEIVNNNWAYTNKINHTVKIDNEQIAYNLYFNLRVTGDYKYSNLFVLVHQTNPDKKTTTTRYELKLANADGEWLGQGSGNLYSFQIPFKLDYKFPAKGTYIFQIEQNMRDNPLREISDVGLRVEKAEKAN
ncbi:gliding motility lipoprotein GldH [Mucilaginibacter sp. UR6-11]|uniref:gliding motility lipoprotein GldH n=1 Tax=Mucilaginibacter sp. UR6-11 TaxID=1435644 RepID=UPI001E5761E6|nr:gliding motility lipoprotein GldH [Mucilaginibacter sp. UR6-11]MCC8424555.1 gliding motility lipoprotein GldH [Mucilaginibacter sp. UR6-11]